MDRQGWTGALRAPAPGRRWRAWLSRSRLGVVLGGGATLGAFEVGVIDVLDRARILPDLLVGTSVGAINAAFWAFDPADGAAGRLLRFWGEANRSTMFPDGPVPMVSRLVQRKSHLTTQSGVARAIARGLPPEALIEDSKVPLALVATGADHGERVVLRRGPVLPALLASTAIPVLFPPVEVDGRRLIDGGAVANCDIEAAVEAGMTDIIVVDVMGHSQAPLHPGVVDAVERALTFTLRRQTDLAVAAFGRRARIAVLRPRLTAHPGVGDFSLTMELYGAGRGAAEAFVARHLRGRRVRPGLFEFPLDEPRPAPEGRSLVTGAPAPAPAGSD